MPCQSTMSRALLLLLAAPVAEAARIAVTVNKHEASGMAGPPLCDKQIVEDTCVMIGGRAEDVSAEDVTKVLSADSTTLAKAWEGLGLYTGERVPCADLCAAAIEYIGAVSTLPPSSDVACYKAGGVTKCDLDLSPASISKLVPKGKDMPDLHDNVPLPPGSQIKGRRANIAEVLARSKTVDYSTHDIAVRTANLFRVYPTPAISIVKEATVSNSFLEEDGSVTILDEARSNSSATCDSVCSRVGTPCKYINCQGCPKCQGTGGGSPVVTTSKAASGVPSSDWKVEVQKRNAQAQAYVNKAIMKLKSRQADKSSLKWFGATANSDENIQAEILRVLNSVANMMGNVEYVYPGPQCSPNTYAYVYPRGSWAKDKSGKFVFYLCDYYMNCPLGEQIETLTHEGSHHATSYTDDVCMDEFYGGKQPTYTEVPKSQFPPTVAVDDTFDYKPPGSAKSAPAVVRFIKGSVVVLQVEPEKNCNRKAYGRQPCADLAKKDQVKALRNADSMCYWIQDVAEQV